MNSNVSGSPVAGNEPPHRWLRAASGLGSLAILGVALFVLHHVAGEFHLNAVLSTFRAITPQDVTIALACTLGSYLALTGYEWLAVRHVGAKLGYARVALTSFMVYAVGHSVGFVPLSGGAIRLRVYSAAGLSAGQITRIVAFCSLTFVLGVATLTGISLIADAGRAASILHANASISIFAGCLVLAAVIVYLVMVSRVRAPVMIRGWSINLPSPRVTALQILVSSADLLFACGALYVLLPDAADISFGSFAGLYMVAMAAGAVSTVPGGLGVFESVLLLLLPGVPADQLLGSLIAYRLIYYLAPFAIAVLLLSAHELAQHRRHIARTVGWTRRSLGLIAPQMIATLAFAAGVVLLLSGSTPAIDTRLATLTRYVPLAILELSHLAASAIGVLLLVLARSLYRRLDAAWHVTVWLLAAGIALSLLKGLDWEEALILTAVLVVLLAARREFYRRAALFAEPLAPAWIASVLVTIGATIWVGLLAYRRVPYSTELWWQFAVDASAPRMLRASLIATLVIAAFATLRLLGPARSARRQSARIDMDRVHAIVTTSSESHANLALLGDKHILFSGSCRSLIMYGVAGRTWVAMSDPIGIESERLELIWELREHADRYGALAAFYQVGPEHLADYVDADLGLSKLGEEARVRLSGFSLEGSARAALRQSHRRGIRDGLSFRIAPVGEVPTLLPRLRAISDEWLTAKALTEKGFSLGFFDERYLRYFPVALVERGGQIVAFANVWQSAGGEELSVDLMRHSSVATGGLMDFLFIELMLWGKAQGFHWFNLGMAPLSGLEARRLAPAWHKVGRLVQRFGEDFYNFEGLRQYKDKFAPEWRPRYLAAPAGLALARVLFDITLLVSGGTRDRATRTAAASLRARVRGAKRSADPRCSPRAG